MKYIFDFDDVLFNTALGFREHIYSTLEKVGVSRDQAIKYLETEIWNQFSLKKMLAHFSVAESLYEEIMSKNKNFVHQELIKKIENLGKENCYIVTYGDKDFQADKIAKAGINHLFSEIIVTPNSKKEAIEKICAKYHDEKILFIDDKAKHFEDLDFEKYPNLKTILYTGQNLESYLQ